MTTVDDSLDSVEPGSSEAAFAELVAEVGDRIRRGEEVDPLDYPGFEGALEDVLPTLRMVTELRELATPQTEVRRLGDFEILREVGRGGMGIVYEAIQSPLGRRVALKVLQRASALDPRQLRRFQLEAQAAASLQHPHLVEVYASGSTDGVPYYAMRFIEGRDLARVIRDRRRQRERAAEAGPGATAGAGGTCAREVARLALQVAEALEHAHACDVVHRDVKPSNLLVDDFGHVWITDFGLARFMGGLDLTVSGDVLGTPRYMSPEQAAGRRGGYDGRADVYSLGATMYEMSTLRPAFSGDDRVDVLRRIVQDEPDPPRKLDPTIPVDLETIILKAMAKSPSDRYATAGDMAADLARFLDDRPIRARRPSLLDRARKLLWRRRKLAAAACLAAAVLGVGLTLVVFQYTLLLRRHNVELKSEVARADRNARRAERHAYVSNIRLAASAVEDHHWEHAQEALDASGAGVEGEDPRGFSWRYLRRLARREIVLFPGPAVATREMLLDRDGAWLLVRGLDQVLRRWDLPAVAPPVRIGLARAGDVRFSSDGRLVVGDRPDAAGRRTDLVVWDAATGEVRNTFPIDPTAREPGRYFDCWLLADGRLAACVWESNEAWPAVSMRIWDVQGANPEPRPLTAVDRLAQAVLAPSGERFVTIALDGVHVRNVFTGEILRKLSNRGDSLRTAALSDDGRFLAACLIDDEVVVYDVLNGGERRRRFGAAIGVVSFDPSGGLVAAADVAGVVHVWDHARDAHHPLNGIDAKLFKGFRAIAFSPDRRFLAASANRQPQGLQPAIVWEIATGRRFGPPPSPEPATDVLTFTPDSRALVIGGSRSPRIWRFDPPPEPPSPTGHKDEGWSVAFSPDGKIMATGSDDTDDPQTIKLWDPENGALIRGWFAGEGTVAALAFTPDGRTLISGHLASKENVRLWNVADGRSLATLVGHNQFVRALALSPDGRTLATGGVDREIRIWDLASRACLRRLEGHVGNVRGLAFSRDSRHLASACAAGGLRVWNMADGAVLHRVSSAVKLVGVAYSPDGALLATADEDGVVMFRDPTTLAEIRSIRGDIDPFIDLAFAPDGRSLATCSLSGTIRLWDTVAAQELLTLKGHGAQVNDVAFSPDGRILASTAHDGSVRLWRGYPEGPAPSPR